MNKPADSPAKKKSGLRTAALETLIYDLFITLAVFIVLTGASPWIRGPLDLLIQQKPWIHRLLVLVPTALAFAWTLARMNRSQTLPGIWERAAARITVLQPDFCLWILFVILSFVWTAGAWMRHAVFHTGFDMAIFVQAIWNTLDGRFLYSSIKGGICLMADHFSPLLAALAIPYGIWTDPRCLLLIQAAAAAGCVFPLYRIALRRLDRPNLALLFPAAFALYLPVRNAVRFDFHPEMLVMPAVLWAFEWMNGRRFRLASLMLFLTLMSKENSALITFAIGIYAFLRVPQGRLFGAAWTAGSAIYFYAVTWLIPRIFQTGYFYLEANFLAWLQLGIPELIKHLLNPDSISYLVKIYGPLGFLSFLDLPSLLLTLPMVAQNLISRNLMTRSIFFHYTAFLTPFVFISAIYGCARIRNGRFTAVWLSAWMLIMSGVADYHVFRQYAMKWRPEFKKIREAFDTIPPGASVRTHEFFAAHLAHRTELHIYENENPLEGRSERALNADYIVLSRYLLGPAADSSLENLVRLDYVLLRDDPEISLLRRKGDLA